MHIRHLVPAFALIAAGCFGSGGKDIDNNKDSDTDDIILDSDSDTGTDTHDSDTGDTEEPNLEWNTEAWNTDWKDAISIDTSANGGKGKVTISLETISAGGPVEMYLVQTRFFGEYAAHEENHTLAEKETEPSGAYTRYERSLDCEAPLASLVPDSNTLFKCSAAVDGFTSEDNGQVTFAIAVWPQDATDTSGTPADCIVFGYSPAILFGGKTTETNKPFTKTPAWATETNCRDVNPPETN